MKFGAQKTIGTLFVGLSLLSGAAHAGSPSWAAPRDAGGPLVSKDACDTYKNLAQIEVAGNQAGRDYADNQYAFYHSVAVQIHDKLKATIDDLNKKYKNFAAVREGLLTTDDQRGTIAVPAEKDLQADFFDDGYMFCPDGTKAFTTDGNDDYRAVRTCKAGPTWKQINNFPPYGVQVSGVHFAFDNDASGKIVPKIKISYSVADQVLNFQNTGTYLDGKKEVRMAPQGNDDPRIYTFEQATVQEIFQDIWPYKDGEGRDTVPTLSPRPEQILRGMLAAKNCLIYEPDYKPNTVTRAKVVDERSAPASGGSSKGAGVTTPK